MKAIGRELTRRNVLPKIARQRGLADQILKKPVEPLARTHDMRAPMENAREVAAVAHVFVRNLRVGSEHRFQTLKRIARTVSNLGELLEVRGDLFLMPSHQDRIDIRKVFVQRGAPDPGHLGYLRHRDRRKTVLRDQVRGRHEDRVAHFVTVRLDRRVPEFRHRLSMRSVDSRQLVLYQYTVYRKLNIIDWATYMTASRTKPGNGAPMGSAAEPSPDSPMPRWVKAFGIVALVVIGLVIVLHLTGHGMTGHHGP